MPPMEKVRECEPGGERGVHRPVFKENTKEWYLQTR
jgi:hypothetical protein